MLEEPPTPPPPPVDNSIRVTFRLIGSTLSTKDVDLADNDSAGYHGAEYVTWIPTTSYTMQRGDSNLDLFVKALDVAGLSYNIRDMNNYVDKIYAPNVLGEYELSEFTNGKYSGWMYTVNGKHPGFGLKEKALSNGDVVVWHYVNDYRYEVSDWFNDLQYPALGDGSLWNRWSLANDTKPSDNKTVTDSGGNIKTDTGTDKDESTITGGNVPLGQLENRENPFSDVSKNDWFYESVGLMNTLGLMNGTSSNVFAPGDNLSRAMLVTILWRLEGSHSISGQGTEVVFTDVADGLWYTDAVIWASSNGIVNGYENGRFGPNDDITREQIATILMRYVNWKDMDTSTTNELTSYTDAGQVSTWALDAMKWANAKGLITGRTETTLTPLSTATRAEVATILARLIPGFASEEMVTGTGSEAEAEAE